MHPYYRQTSLEAIIYQILTHTRPTTLDTDTRQCEHLFIYYLPCVPPNI